MKKLFLVIGVLFSFISVSAQQADMRIGELINKSDWFSLEKEFPQLKDSVQTKFLKLLAEIMIDNNFNRPEEALKNINELLTNHQQEMAFGNTCNMVSLSAIIDGQRGNYAQAADKIKSFTEQLKSLGVAMDFTSYEVLYNNYNELREYPAPSISRPIKDIEIPVAIEPVKLLKPIDGETSRGLKIDIPVTIHNKQYKFIFDTGAASTYMSERFAKEVGVKIIADSVLLNEGMMGEGFGMKGFLDSLQIGDIVFKNAMVAIGKANAAVDSIVQVDAVLGMDFMKLMQEVQIYTKEEKIVFPIQRTPTPATGKNLLLTNGNKLILKAYSNDERLLFFFDTGNNRADLFSTYYAKHKDQIDGVAQKETVTGGGFGFIRTKEVVRAPSVSFFIGKTPIEMKDIRVHPIADNEQTQEDGNLGMDLIKQSDRTIINLQDMFVSFE